MDGFIKVVGFPVPDDCPFAGESMWVRKISGDENEGVGELSNVPAFCTEVEAGDTVKYGGGDDQTRPHYLGRV